MKKVTITETQLKKALILVLKEQGLYGDNSDVVDYDLPEYLSDVIILNNVESFEDVQKSLKELHKRLIRLEKGLDHAGSHNKAYSTDTGYSGKNRKFKDFEDKDESFKRDEELRQELEKIQKDIERYG